VHANRRSAGLPRRLKLLIIELAGIAMMVAGLLALFLGMPPHLSNPFGVLLLVLAGVDLLLRPGARRKPPRVDRLVLKAIDRWRSPPAV
jgi:hypothetical protein